MCQCMISKCNVDIPSKSASERYKSRVTKPFKMFRKDILSYKYLL